LAGASAALEREQKTVIKPSLGVLAQLVIMTIGNIAPSAQLLVWMNGKYF
jgi:hypothetical protein